MVKKKLTDFVRERVKIEELFSDGTDQQVPIVQTDGSIEMGDFPEGYTDFDAINAIETEGIDYTDAKASDAAPVQSVNGGTGNVTINTVDFNGEAITVSDTEPNSPNTNDLWIDTS